MRSVPSSLRKWFVFHFVVDMLTGIPLLFFPQVIVPLLGLTDLVAVRVVGAAMLAIGGASLVVRNSTREVFDALLVLKIIWSSFAIVGLIWSILVRGSAETLARLQSGD